MSRWLERLLISNWSCAVRNSANPLVKMRQIKLTLGGQLDTPTVPLHQANLPGASPAHGRVE